MRAEEQPMKDQKKEWPLQGETTYQGLNIAIENKKGSTRSGKEPSGKPWSIKMPFDYGYVKNSEGKDGDEVDVFLGPDKDATHVFIVHQRQHDTKDIYDEDKVMLGWDSADAAKQAYHSAYKNADLFISMTMMSIDEFKEKLKSHTGKKINAGGPGSGRHPYGRKAKPVDLQKHSKEDKLTERRTKQQQERQALNKQGLSQRGKPIVSDRAKLALANSGRVAGKAEQDIAEKNEDRVTKALGAIKSHDNSPFDVTLKVGNKNYGIEVKALINQKNDKITMKSDAIDRKTAYAAANGIKPAGIFTVAIDYRSSMSNPTVYIRQGVGSFRVANMEVVKGGFKGLKAYFGGKK